MKVTVSVGGTFHAFRLAEQLAARGMLHRLVTTHCPLRGERIPPDRIAVNPWPEAFMRVPRKLGFRWHAGDRVKAVAFDRWAARHVDGCDVWVGFALFSLAAQRAARAAGARTVLERGSTHILTHHALLAEEYRRWRCPATPVDRRLVARQLEEYDDAQHISVPSRFALQSFLDRGFPPDRLLRIPYGADTRLFSPGPPRGRPFRIVAVGLSLRKGTPYLLEAAGRLGLTGAQGGPDMEVWLAGAVASDVAGVLRRTRVPVRLLGALSHTELAAVYRSASAFVLPSVEEGMALSVLEALASGLPVVVTPNTGAGDIITHGREGLIVPAGDAAALADALLNLYEDEPKRRSMAEAAAATAAQWTWDAYGNRVAAAYAMLDLPA
ncbi:MAG TPA: glycosyltransferase family 4 protein [bacterium]|nr:glycosyltransferase family 4 protein [bacterium]